MIREDRLGKERRLATESAWSVTKDKTDNAPNSSKCVTARSLVQMVSVSQIFKERNPEWLSGVYLYTVFYEYCCLLGN